MRCRKSTNELLPMLCYLCDHGNVTLHQWKTGEIPQVRNVTFPVCVVLEHFYITTVVSYIYLVLYS